MTFRSLCWRHLCTRPVFPNTALMAVRKAFEPSMTNKRRRSGSTPHSTKLWSKSFAAAAFSVAPSCIPRTCLLPLSSTPTAPITHWSPK
jgi:hypothetical protein